jgi:hypothetical protein
MKQFTIQLDSKISITYTYIMKTDFAEKITVSNFQYPADASFLWKHVNW